MKRLSILIATLLTGLMMNAQTETGNSSDDMNTIFGKSNDVKVGWYIGLDQGYSKFDNKDVWIGGLRGGMIINHQFTVGLSGQGWMNHKNMYYPNVTDTAGAYLEGGYGGLLLEYTLFPKSAVHVTFPVLIGGGGATYISEKDYLVWDDNDWDTKHSILDYDAFFVVEPGVRAEINICKFMRFDAGVSYRYTAGFNMLNTPDNLLNNFNIMAGLKFGKF